MLMTHQKRQHQDVPFVQIFEQLVSKVQVTPRYKYQHHDGGHESVRAMRQCACDPWFSWITSPSCLKFLSTLYHSCVFPC